MEEHKKFVAIFGGLIAVYFVLFFLYPDSIESFALAWDAVENGELWRFLSYQFVHLNTTHLYENTISLCLIVFLAIELKMNAKDTTSVYLLTGLVAVLPIWFFLKSTLLGASAAIYGGFGMNSLEMKKFNINPVIIVVLVVIIAMSKWFVALFNGQVDASGYAFWQGVLHLAGMVFGLIAYYAVQKAKPYLEYRKRRCLRSMQ